MKIYLNQIPKEGMDIDKDIVLAKEIYEKTDIKDFASLRFKGCIFYDNFGTFSIEGKVLGKFILEDARTLDNIEYPFSCQICEKITNLEEIDEKFYEKSKNRLDISEILWENIVLEVPIKATLGSSNLLQKGNGWELKDE